MGWTIISKNTNFTGNLIKEARENYKYTTEECAEKLGISTRYLQKIENEGNLPSYGTLRNIVQLFSMDANYLFYDNYNKDDFLRSNVIQKIKLCDDYELNVISATLNALPDKK